MKEIKSVTFRVTLNPVQSQSIKRLAGLLGVSGGELIGKFIENGMSWSFWEPLEYDMKYKIIIKELVQTFEAAKCCQVQAFEAAK